MLPTTCTVYESHNRGGNVSNSGEIPYGTNEESCDAFGSSNSEQVLVFQFKPTAKYCNLTIPRTGFPKSGSKSNKFYLRCKSNFR